MRGAELGWTSQLVNIFKYKPAPQTQPVNTDNKFKKKEFLFFFFIKIHFLIIEKVFYKGETPSGIQPHSLASLHIYELEGVSLSQLSGWSDGLV